jgi:hypothetical protein
MWRKSVSKILSSSLQCSRFSSKSTRPHKPHNKEWWNEPIEDCTPCEETKISSKTLQLPASDGSKTVSVVDSAKSVSYTNYEETPCHKKKHSPCAEKAKPQPTKIEPVEEKCYDESEPKPTKADCKDHKTLVPPSNVLESLKSYEVKSTCTSFSIKADN